MRWHFRTAFWTKPTRVVRIDPVHYDTAAASGKALSRLDDRSYCSSQAATDAAAVNTLLRAARVAMPERVTGALELESGFNDPISVFLTILLSQG